MQGSNHTIRREDNRYKEIPLLPLVSYLSPSSPKPSNNIPSFLPLVSLVCSSSLFIEEREREREELKVELANREAKRPHATTAEEERNKQLVQGLYEALNGRHVEVVRRLLKPDLDWWFHGPRTGQHLMRHLTGQSGDPFEFVLESVEAFGSTVLVEGAGPAGDGYWVHAWTVGPDGVIIRVREYFNTTLTVTKVGDGSVSNREASPTSVTHCLPLWQSKPMADKSLPGLILAI